MIGNSPTHTVPDREMILPGVQEETFYSSQVLSGPHQQAQLMDTSESDCSSDDGKVYVSLVTERQLCAQVPSSPTLEKLWPMERVNLHSWKNRHPKNWSPQDISNWIYYVCSKSKHMDCYKIQAENFNTLCGADLCSMSLDDFVKREPNYGMDIYYCLQGHLKSADYKAPVDDIDVSCYLEQLTTSTESTYLEPGCGSTAMWSAGAMLGEEEDMELPDGQLRSLELLECNNPGSGIAVVGGKPYDFISDDGFEDILPKPTNNNEESSGYGSDDSGRSSSPESAPVPPPAHSSHITCPPGVPPHVHAYGAEHLITHTVHPPPAHLITHTVHPPPAHLHHTPEPMYQRPDSTCTHPKPRGRPKHTTGQRGRKPGQASKGTHLWKFIRDIIFDSHYNPEVIRWENEQQGVFRIVNSAEIARLWGEKKNNPSMTYEKFSRAMRYCRKQGDFGSLPKDQNLPKKLCFRFGSCKKWKV